MSNQEKKRMRLTQRFANYAKAFKQLETHCDNPQVFEYSDLEKIGIIQIFEFTIELGWKLLKDYLDYEDVELAIISPKRVIQEAAASGILEKMGVEAEVVFDMVESRNQMSHLYDEAVFKKVFTAIVDEFYPELRNIHRYFEDIAHDGIWL